MKLLRSVIVFDASDLDVESAFWAADFIGFVLKDTQWHSVKDEFGEWQLGVQLNPTHVRPDWPNEAQ